jgi:CHAT domain-containing protein
MKSTIIIILLFLTSNSFGQDTLSSPSNILQEQLLNMQIGGDSLKNTLLKYMTQQGTENAKDDAMEQQIRNIKVGDKSLVELMFNNNGESLSDDDQAALMQQFLNLKTEDGPLGGELKKLVPRFESLTDLYVSPPHTIEYTGGGMYNYALHQKEIELEWGRGLHSKDRKHLEAMEAFDKKYDTTGPILNSFNGRDLEKEQEKANKIPFEEVLQDEKLMEEYIAAQVAALSGETLKPFKPVVEAAQVKWQQIHSSLMPSTAAIEFIHTKYRDGKWSDIYNYYAMIIRPDVKTPKLIFLGDAVQLEEILSSGKNLKTENLYTRGGIAIGKRTQTGKELYNFVWSKVDNDLKGIGKVYYSPSGKLHALAFGALQDDEKKLLANKYELHQLGTTRALVDGIGDLYPPKESCWVIAGYLSYHEYPKLALDGEKDPCNITMQTVANSAKLPPDDELQVLEGTRTELEDLSEKLTKNGIGFQAFSGTEAPEEFFKELGSKYTAPGVIHIGTHGFYFSDEITLIENDFIDKQDGRLKVNPLSLSGLYLSGAAHQKHFKYPFPQRADGYWTAEEIAGQDLKNTKLVVLSACSSGLGDIKIRDGVFGLQRGFKAAGVDKMLVSLWEIDDLGTAAYMDYFYTHWLSGMTAFQAYQQTQKDMQQHPLYNTPFYWAGFVLLE